MNGPPGGEAMASPEQKLVQDFMESCPFKAGTASVVGFGMGGLLGMFLSGVDFSSTSDLTGKPFREIIRITYRDMATRAWSSAKGFAVVAAMYSGSECAIESYRAKNDIYNSVSAGCVTGGVLAGKSGPVAALGGCASFAAFSAAIDWYMKEREE
ncbi:Mitochondrial import inner membrane translocase subunit tim22 [Sorochytrium milnesiophthora]